MEVDFIYFYVSIFHTDRYFPKEAEKQKYEVSAHTKDKHDKFINQ